MDRDHLHVWLTADALPEQVPMAAHVLLSTFETLATTGAREDELAEYRRQVEDGCESPAGPVVVLQSQARAVLNGKPPRSAADSIRLAAEVIPADVAKAAQTLRESMLVAAPYDMPAVQGRMGRVPSFSAATIPGGRVHKPSKGAWPTLTVSDEGLMLTRAPGEQVTVRYADAAVLLRWNDGKRSLIGGDGFAVTLDPAQWKDGGAVVPAVTARIPEDLIASLDRPGPATPRPQPASQAGATPRNRLVRLVTDRTFVIVCIALLIMGGVLWAASSGSVTGYSPLAAVAVVVARVALTSRRRRR